MTDKLSKSSKRTQQRLMQRVLERQQNRAASLAETKWYADRLRTIVDAPRRTPMEFWCRVCESDFTCVDALKMTTTMRGVPSAYYDGRCPKNHRAIRHLTDKHLDPYYYQSAMLAEQRYRMRDDTIAPSDPRFRIVYPKQWAAIEEEREQREQKEAAQNEQVYG